MWSASTGLLLPKNLLLWSRALLDRAHTWFAPASAAFATLRKQAEADRATKRDVPAYLGLDEYLARLSTGLEMRMAVTRAALTADPDDLAHADEVLKSFENPFYRTAGDEAFNHGDDFCDIGDRNDLAEYHAACDSGNFEHEAVAWWRYRAWLDILAEQEPSELGSLSSAYTALRLLDRFEESRSDPGTMWRYTDGAEQRAMLHIARAEALLRFADEARTGDVTRYAELLVEAAGALARAEQLTPPSDQPQRFRRFATRFLDVFARMQALPGDTSYVRHPGFARKAAYFRAVLDRLDAIALARP